MTDPQAPELHPVEPTRLPDAPTPGWTTSEFLSTMLVHAVSVLAILLDMLHVNWSRGLSSVEAAIPVLAVAISAVLQGAYADYRTKLKVKHLQENARIRIVQIETEMSKVETVAKSLSSGNPAAADELVNVFATGIVSPPQVVVSPTINVPPCPRCGATEVTDNRQ